MAKAFKYLILGLLSGGLLWGADKPNFDELIPKFIAKVEADSKYIGENFTHQEIEKIKNFKNETFESEKNTTYQVEKRGDALYKKPVQRDGVIISNSDFEKKTELLSVGVALLGRYDFVFERVDGIDKNNFFVFSFKPKKGSLTFTGKKEDAYGRMAGEIWISKDDLTFKKLTAHLVMSVTFSNMWGKAKFERLTCTMTATNFEGHFAVESFSADYVYTVKAFSFIPILSNRHEVREVQYQNYERRKQ